METAKTLWRKNLDSKYISGEDLMLGVKGLKPEMIVELVRFNDDKTFDKNKAADVMVSALYLKEIGGANLYKPVILNKTNAKFFVKETGSDYIEDWIGRPVVMFAQKDSRFGHVVRFKTYVLPELKASTPNFDKCKTALKSGGFTIADIKLKYRVSPEIEKLLTAE